jgi:hypothetical protein
VKRSTLLGLVLLLTYVGGCKVSCTTANISSLKLSKDEKGTVQTKEFAPGDTVYITATVSNNPGNVKLTFRVVAEKVEGVQENLPIPSSEKSMDLPGSGYATYHLSPPPQGWPAGRYRAEVVMLYNGEQKDQKSDTFTVTGASGGGMPPTSPAATPSSTGGETPEEDANDSEDGSPDK